MSRFPSGAVTSIAQTAECPKEVLWGVDLPGTDEAVPVLRRWVRALVDVPGLELVASEYGTNALWHSASGLPGGRIRVELALGVSWVRLSVQDDGPKPVREEWNEECLDEHGRGLVLVQAHVDECGEFPTPEGKHVAWALIRI